MTDIGFDGGSFLCKLGPSTDVITFFNCVDEYVVQTQKFVDYTLLTDRLYRRYLRIEELDDAVSMMLQVEELFTKISSDTVNWEMIGRVNTDTRLDVSQGTLAGVFAKYFYHFNKCVESAQVFFNSWNIYQPVRIVIADMPEFLTDKKRPLEQYDLLEGRPFWLR